MTLAEVLALYQSQGCADKSPRTLRTDAAGLRAVAQALGTYRVDTKAATGALRGADVSRYREARKAAGVSPSTIQRELAVASAACRWAISENDMDITNPFAGRLISKADRKAIQPRDRVLTTDEANRLILAADPLMADIIAFALETGFRRDEIRLLTNNRIQGALVTFRPCDQKSGRHGVRALSGAAQAIVARQPAGVFVFGEMNVDRFDYLWGLARKRAGVECVFHDARRTFAHRARERGVPLQDISAQMGHSDTRTTERVYAQAGEAAALRAVQ
jgi:integrase